MSTNYNTIATEYRASKMMPWRLHVEAYTFFQMTGALSGLSVLDLACGEGFYTRQLRANGASEVVGVDISAEMIRLAQESEKTNPLGLTYHVQDVMFLNLSKKFDLVCAAYLLNYAKNPGELEQMGRIIAEHLKPGGRFITINSNPDYQGTVEAMFPYGFNRENKGKAEGTEIIYRLYQPGKQPIEVTNYHHAKDTHETALKKAGFSDVWWHSLEVSSEGVEAFGKAHWEPLLTYQPVIGLSCTKL